VGRKSKLVPSRDEGQALVEYGLVLGLVALVCVAAVSTFGGVVNTWLEQIAGAL
jgi:Flp pilus assembly pilin Flp